MKVIKIPKGITREELLKHEGTEGSMLNPIADNDGNLIVSVTEFEAKEFSHVWDGYKDFEFTEIDYVPIPMPNPHDETKLAQRKDSIDKMYQKGVYEVKGEDIKPETQDPIKPITK